MVNPFPAIWWRVRRVGVTLYFFVDGGIAHAILHFNCTDFDIINRDWPTWGGWTKNWTPYQVRASAFFCHGRGVGRTMTQAARRAVRSMRRHKAKMRKAGIFATWDDLADL